jgi:hypothetical protein
MEWPELISPIEPEVPNPEIFYDDQPVESLIYQTRTIAQPSPVDMISREDQIRLYRKIFPARMN